MSKPIKTHEWTAQSFTEPGEKILCAFIIGPDRDEPRERTLHFRTNAIALEEIKKQPLEIRIRFLQDATRLLESLTEKVLA